MKTYKIDEDTKMCPLDDSKNLVSVEYWYGSKQRYGGISEYMFQPCGHRFGRWTGKIIPEGFCEPRYGEGGKPVKAEGDSDDDI